MSDQRTEPTVEKTRPRRGFTEADPKRTERPRRSSQMAWFLAGLMLAMVLAVELPNQIVAWRFAAALEARESGDKEAADKLLAEVLERRPDETSYLAERFRWDKEDGKYAEALEYLQRRFAAKPTKTEKIVELLEERCSVYQHLGRHPEAIADCEELLRLSQSTGTPKRETALNALAYARAVAGVNLEAALADANAAIVIDQAELLDAEQKLQKGTGDLNDVVQAKSKLASCLDTRGFLLTKLNKFEAAQVDLDQAISYFNSYREFSEANKDGLTKHARLYKQYTAEKKLNDHNDAVVYYHRSLNLEKLGRKADAEKDFAKAKELAGREPDETLF